MAHDQTVKKQIFIYARPEEIWKALTTPELVKEFMFNCAVRSEWTKGSAIYFEDYDRVQVQGQIVEIDEPRRLEYTTFDPERPADNDPMNHLLVQIELFPEETGTMVKVQQGDFSHVHKGEERFKQAEAGWEHSLEGLKRVVERQGEAS